MNNYKIIFLLLSLFLFSEIDLYAQGRNSNRRTRSKSRQISSYRGNASSAFGIRAYNSVTFAINSMNYFGDLAPKAAVTSTDISFTRPGLSVGFERKLLPRLSVRANLLVGRLKGSDYKSADPNDQDARFRYVRNLQFRNDIIEFSGIAVIDFFENYGSFVNRPNFSPYVFVGLAVFYHNPKGLVPETNVNNGSALAQAGQWVALEPLGTEGQYSAGSGVSTYSKVQLAIPAGLGIRFRLNQGMDLSMEVGYRHLFFDHIDDVGGDFIDLNLLNNELSQVMSDRSRELVDVESGIDRELTNPSVAEIWNRRDANGLIPGYGSSGKDNIRGDGSDNDIYIVTSIKLTYILGGSIFGGAKYR